MAERVSTSPDSTKLKGPRQTPGVLLGGSKASQRGLGTLLKGLSWRIKCNAKRFPTRTLYHGKAHKQKRESPLARAPIHRKANGCHQLFLTKGCNSMKNQNTDSGQAVLARRAKQMLTWQISDFMQLVVRVGPA